MKYYMTQERGLSTIEKVEISKESYDRCRKLFDRHKKSLIRHDGKLYKIYGVGSSDFYGTEHKIIVSFVANDIIDI